MRELHRERAPLPGAWEKLAQISSLTVGDAFAIREELHYEREAYEEHFLAYIRAAWPVIDPTPCRKTRHVGALGERLEALADVELHNLLKQKVRTKKGVRAHLRRGNAATKMFSRICRKLYRHGRFART